MSSLPLLPPILLAALLAWAAYGDVRRFLIPNWISVAAILLFAAAGVAAPQTPAFLSHLGSGFLVFLIGLALFARGAMGGGDVKLWAATALWFGLPELPLQLAAIGLAGGILTLVLLALRALPWRRAANGDRSGPSLPRVLRKGEPVPYGVAISLGTLVALPTSPVVQPWLV